MIAYELAKSIKKYVPECWEENSVTEDWLYGFRQGHPKNSL